MSQTFTTLLQNQATIMLALRALLYPHASDHPRTRDAVAQMLTEQINHTWLVVEADEFVSPAPGSSDPAGEDIETLDKPEA